MEVSSSWYRVSVKGIIYSDTGKVLLCKEESGIWDLPGGGLDWGEDPIHCLQRELYEEMGLVPNNINTQPKVFIAIEKPDSQLRPWISNICYEVTMDTFKFTPSDECLEIGFFDVNDLEDIRTFPNVDEVFKKIFE